MQLRVLPLEPDLILDLHRIEPDTLRREVFESAQKTYFLFDDLELVSKTENSCVGARADVLADADSLDCSSGLVVE